MDMAKDPVTGGVEEGNMTASTPPDSSVPGIAGGSSPAKTPVDMERTCSKELQLIERMFRELTSVRSQHPQRTTTEIRTCVHQ